MDTFFIVLVHTILELQVFLQRSSSERIWRRKVRLGREDGLGRVPPHGRGDGGAARARARARGAVSHPRTSLSRSHTIVFICVGLPNSQGEYTPPPL